MAWLNLDIRSVIVMLVAANLLALVLIGFSRSHRTLLRTERAYMAGKLAQVLAWLLLAARGHIPDLLSAYLGNTALFLGMALEADAFLAMVSRNRRWGQALAAFAACGALLFWTLGSTPSRWVVLASATTAIIYGTASAGLLGNRERSRLRLFLGALFAACSAFFLVRAAGALDARPAFELMSRNLFQTLAFLAAFTLAAGGAAGFPLLAKEEGDRRLRESEARFSALFQASPTAMLLTRLEDGRILAVNQQFERWTGHPAREAVGATTLGLGLFVEPATRDRIAARLAERGEIRDLEMAFHVMGNEIRQGLLFAVPLEISGEALILSSVHDITERKAQELERERMITELQQALADIRTLKGLLPICASCKKIRDDRGYWNQLELYVAQHSEAEFTHGLCPECAKAFLDEK